MAESIDRLNLNIDEVLTVHCPRRTEIEELRTFAVELAERVRLVSVELNSMFYSDDVPEDLDELSKQGVRYPKADAEIYEAVLKVIARRRPRTRGLLEVGIVQVDSAAFREDEPMETLFVAERTARHNHDAAAARLELATSSLDLKGEPARLGEALTVLVAFALMGIVYPSIVLAVGPTSLGWIWRLTIVGFFLLGLLLLLGYLVQSVRSLANNAVEKGTTNA
jgi:hypothetical protein